MKNPELYQKTMDILVNAYFNDTLAHGDCYACAVGNIVAANMNYYVVNNSINSLVKKLEWKKDDKIIPYPGFTFINDKVEIIGWAAVFSTSSNYQRMYLKNYIGDAKIQIDSTGYSVENLAKIEFAFETASRKDDWMFNGLMAVVDVLDEIHENKNEELTISTKKRFSKKERLTEL